MLVVMNPSGSVNTVFTVIGTSTAGLNSTAQVRVTSDPKGGIGLGMLLDSVTEVGAGTAMIMIEMEDDSESRSTSTHSVINSCSFLN